MSIVEQKPRALLLHQDQVVCLQFVITNCFRTRTSSFLVFHPILLLVMLQHVVIFLLSINLFVALKLTEFSINFCLKCARFNHAMDIRRYENLSRETLSHQQNYWTCNRNTAKTIINNGWRGKLLTFQNVEGFIRHNLCTNPINYKWNATCYTWKRKWLPANIWKRKNLIYLDYEKLVKNVPPYAITRQRERKKFDRRRRCRNFNFEQFATCKWLTTQENKVREDNNYS